MISTSFEELQEACTFLRQRVKVQFSVDSIGSRCKLKEDIKFQHVL